MSRGSNPLVVFITTYLLTRAVIALAVGSVFLALRVLRFTARQSVRLYGYVQVQRQLAHQRQLAQAATLVRID